MTKGTVLSIERKQKGMKTRGEDLTDLISHIPQTKER